MAKLILAVSSVEPLPVAPNALTLKCSVYHPAADVPYNNDWLVVAPDGSVPNIVAELKAVTRPFASIVTTGVVLVLSSHQMLVHNLFLLHLVLY